MEDLLEDRCAARRWPFMRPVLALPLALALVLAACGSAGSPPRPIAQVAPASAPAGCLPARFRDAALVGGFSVHDGRARLCFGLGPDFQEMNDHACLLFDAEGQIVGEPAWEPPKPDEFPEDEHKVTASAGSYTVCARKTKSCTSFPMAHPLAQAMPEHDVVSDDGSLAFVLHDTPPGRHSQYGDEIIGELYETHGGRLLGSVKLTTTLGAEFGDTGMTRAVHILGPRAVIVGAYPAGPGGITAVVDPGTGKGLALHGFGGDHLVLDARTMLVIDESELGSSGKAPLDLSIVDLATVTVSKKLTLPGRTFEDPERNAMSMTRLGGVVLIVTARPASLSRYDIAARGLSTPHPLPLCPE